MKKSSYTELGREINNYLKKLRWSQRELARRANISSSNVSKIMRGEHTPNAETLTVIGSTLGIDPMHLMRLADILPSSNQSGRDPAIEHIAQRLDGLSAEFKPLIVASIRTQIDAIERIESLSKAKPYDTKLNKAEAPRVVVEPVYEDDPEEVRKVKINKIVAELGVLFPAEVGMIRGVLGEPPGMKIEKEFA